MQHTKVYVAAHVDNASGDTFTRDWVTELCQGAENSVVSSAVNNAVNSALSSAVDIAANCGICGAENSAVIGAGKSSKVCIAL